MKKYSDREDLRGLILTKVILTSTLLQGHISEQLLVLPSNHKQSWLFRLMLASLLLLTVKISHPVLMYSTDNPCGPHIPKNVLIPIVSSAFVHSQFFRIQWVIVLYCLHLLPHEITWDGSIIPLAWLVITSRSVCDAPVFSNLVACACFRWERTAPFLAWHNPTSKSVRT